jgi:P2 family phage contractile tail tube protein
MSNLFIMEAANLFCGDDDPTDSKHLSLGSLKLPVLQRKYQDHHAGGSRVGIEIDVGIEKLEATFSLIGWDPEVLAQFGLGSRVQRAYTAYGVIRDKRTGRSFEAKAVMEGQLGKVESDAFQRGELQGHEYMINGFMSYALHFDGRKMFAWDFQTSELIINGQSENADERRILRIPG